MRIRTARWLAWAIGLPSIALFVGAIVFAVIDSGSLPAGEDAWFDIAVEIGLPVIGIIIATRRPENAIGWIFLTAGFFLSVATFGHLYALHGLHVDRGSLPGPLVAAFVSNMVAFIPIGLLPLLLLLFPTGHLPSRRWRPLAWFIGGVTVVLTVSGTVLAASLYTHPFTDAGKSPSELGNVVTVVFLIGALSLPVAIILSFVSVAVRYRHANVEERLQLKWFVTAAAFAALAFSVGVFFDTRAVALMIDFAQLFLFAAVLIAMLKHRLYDIDVIIGKSLVYGGLAFFITAVYVVFVVVIGAFAGATEGLSLIATAIVAVAFQPARERVQRFANHVVYGKRATPYEVLSQFAESVEETYAGEDILPRMARLLAEGTGASDAVVWLRVGSELRPIATWPAGSSFETLQMSDGHLPTFEPGTEAAGVRHQGEILGALSLTKPPNEPLTPTEQKLLSEVAAQAGLVLGNFRLIEDLRSSRQRLVEAQDEERRRIERNLHDGAQQQLVALAVQLKLARKTAEDDLAKADGMLAELESQVVDALENLRDLARGIYPPLLADKGLISALEAQIRKAAVPATLEANGIERYPQEVEAAVYFCCLEALQNVAKYAEASQVTVRLSAGEHELAFAVRDDGRGFDTRSTPLGAGLQNMTDRLAALGGTLEVRSRLDAGTTVAGRIPIRVPEPATPSGG